SILVSGCAQRILKRNYPSAIRRRLGLIAIGPEKTQNTGATVRTCYMDLTVSCLDVELECDLLLTAIRVIDIETYVLTTLHVPIGKDLVIFSHIKVISLDEAKG